MRRALRIAMAVIGLQGALLVAYFAVDRAEPPPGADVVAIGQPAPAFTYEARHGDGALADHRGRPMLLHFWATWCPPCRSELPGLLALAETAGLDVLAVALDPAWGPVERFLEPLPPAIVLGRSEVAVSLYGVETLPATFALDAGGIVRGRVDGARDWTSREAWAFLATTLGHRALSSRPDPSNSLDLHAR